jgi:16S rRNA C967 or C1407 C5-methylase (RsmB/RsmF family)
VSSHPDFQLEDLAARWPSLRFPHALAGADPGSSRLERDVRRRAVLTLPHRDRTAGFFIAALRRR